MLGIVTMKKGASTMNQKPAVERIWNDFTNSADYMEGQDNQEVIDTRHALDEAIKSVVGDDWRQFIVKNEGAILEFGNAREKEGFMKGFRLAAQLMAECFALNDKEIFG